MRSFLKKILYISSVFCLFVACSSDGYEEESNEATLVGVDTYGYIKDDENTPLSGVVVSDGFVSVTTDNTGLYKFNRNKEARFVRYSLPSGYEAELHPVYKLPKIYERLQPQKEQYNFRPKKTRANSNRFDLITIADPQVNSTDDISRFEKEIISDVIKYVKSAGVPCYGITLGDHVNNKWKLFSNLLMTMRYDISNIQIYPTVGNHDFEFPKNTEAESLRKYENYFGPTEYSINIGDTHIVSINNVLHTYTGSANYEAGLSETRLEWLKQDLSYVPKDKMVILCLHIPIINKVTIKYNTEILNMLAEFKTAAIMSAHTHSNYKYIHTVKDKEIVEHVTGTSCGAWWRSTVCTDGSPIGFGVFRIDGANIKEWAYKAARHDESFQIRLYKASDKFTGGGDTPYQFDYSADNQIVANIWNWDAKWEVYVYEDGVKTGRMSRFSGKDAWTSSFHLGILGMNNTSYSSTTNHLFYYTLKNPKSEVKVLAIDRFGNEYQQSVFADPNLHPGLYHNDF